MGDWNTLHLLNEEEYKSKTLPILKSPELLSTYFTKYLRFCIPGRCKWTVDFIVETVNQNSFAFTNLTSIKPGHDENKFHTPNELDDYDFRKFIAFLIFETCSDFYPYFKLGKNFVQSSIKINWDTVSGEILWSLFNYGGQFNWDGDGIRKIILNDDLNLLFMDTENITPKKKDTEQVVDEFLYFLDFARKNQFAVLSGQNIDDTPFRNNISRLDEGIKSGLQHLIYFEKNIANKT